MISLHALQFCEKTGFIPFGNNKKPLPLVPRTETETPK